MISRDHGSPFDRGAADSYYRRGKVPHKIIKNEIIWLKPDTEEWKEYHEGYRVNEEIENHKDWGRE